MNRDNLVSYNETLSEDENSGIPMIDTMGEDSDNANSLNADEKRKTKLLNYPQSERNINKN